MSLLKVQHLSCGYNAKKVIQDVSFTVTPGEVVGIIGPNGAGKTTLFRVITRILKPSSGEIRYLGRDIQEIPLRELAQLVAVLPQGLPLTFPFTVWDFVLMGRLTHLGRLSRIRERDLELADEMMRLTEVSNLSARHITELSGGELQRVLLAQALAQEPHLLLLDEPTTHLDIGHQVEIMDLIKSLNKRRQLTVVMVLHDLNLASNYCDRLILLNEGRVYAMGRPEDVLTYQNIEAVYKTVVVVGENPVSKRPHILLVPKEKWKS